MRSLREASAPAGERSRARHLPREGAGGSLRAAVLHEPAVLEASDPESRRVGDGSLGDERRAWEAGAAAQHRMPIRGGEERLLYKGNT